MFATLALALLLAAPTSGELAVNADAGERLLPVQARVSLSGLAGRGSAFGANLYVGYTLGRLHGGRGPFLGLGVQPHLGSIDVASCAPAALCATRWLVGPAIRAGYAWGVAGGGEPVWPDTIVYAQLSPFGGAEDVASAPLSPALSARVTGARLDLGVTSVAWSRGFLHLSSQVVDVLHGSDAVVLGVALLPLVLLNSLELSVEWSQGSIDHDGFRAGLSVGAGF